MLWLDNALLFKQNESTSTDDIVAFVNGIISCDNKEIGGDLVELQTHRHTHFCHPKPGRPCRFDKPFFPMDKTGVLFELEPSDPGAKTSKQLAISLREKLNNK